MGGMIPLGDVSRRPRDIPALTILIIILNGLMFALELQRGDRFVLMYSIIPADIAAGRSLVNLLTAMFMHTGWMHIVGNTVFLWVFRPQIEASMGWLCYMAFYLLSGLVALLAQIISAPGSTIPNLGASGAIAGVMGAFLVTFPADRIRTLVLFGWYARVTVIPASLLIALWFFIQVFSQVGAVVTAETGGVAYLADIGGFLFGAVTARQFEKPRRIAAQMSDDDFQGWR